MGSGDRRELDICASTTFFTQLASAIIIVLAGLVVTLKPDLLFSKNASAEHLQIGCRHTGYEIYHFIYSYSHLTQCLLPVSRYILIII